MGLIVKEYSEMVNRKYKRFNPIVIVYGSNCYGDTKNDLDVCVIVKETFDALDELINDTILFSMEYGLNVDDEIPHCKKLVYTYEEIEKILMDSLFINEDGEYIIGDVVKDKNFLSSEEMRQRLLINILTTEHYIMSEDIQFVKICEEKAWLIIIDAIINTYHLDINSTEETFLSFLYKNPYTGAEGESYLGYKKNFPQKEAYIKKKLEQYLAIYREINVDLSANTNPYYPSPRMLAKLQNIVGITKKYPANKDIPLRTKIGEVYNLDEKYIMATNGAMEAIHLIISHYIMDTAAIIQPTFWGYDDRFRKLGKEYFDIITDIENYYFDIRKACSKYKYVLLCNPNNPTLTELTLRKIEDLLRDFPQCTLIIDETCMPFKKDYINRTAINLVQGYSNVIVIMSLSKISGMCGLRCGFIAANKNIITDLFSKRALYSTNSLSQHYFEYYAKLILNSCHEKQKIHNNFIEFIDKLDKRYISSIRNNEGAFILINLKNNVDIEHLENELIRHKIFILYLKKAYPKVKGNWIRISAGTRDHLMKLVKLLNIYMETITSE